MSNGAEEVSRGRSRIGAQPTVGGSTYVKPQEMDWSPTQFAGVSIKVLYEDKEKGEMTCLLKWAPGTSLPMHKHPEIEQTLRDRRLVLRSWRHQPRW
jgi:anti-sigma factor ChrR (cupin superfamily)